MKLVSVNLDVHAYQLENKEQDKTFLSGLPVTCRAVLKDSPEIPRGGDVILIQLSNGRKFKGRVVDFRSFAVEKYLAGDLVIMKA